MTPSNAQGAKMANGPSRQCKSLRERLPEYADGSLTGGAAARVEDHLASCPHCSEELAALRTVIAAVRATEPEPAPEGLMPRIRRALAEAAPTPSGVSQFWARLAVPVALATGLVAISFAFHATRPRESAPLSSAGRLEAGPREASPQTTEGDRRRKREPADSFAAPADEERGLAGGAEGIAVARPGGAARHLEDDLSAREAHAMKTAQPTGEAMEPPAGTGRPGWYRADAESTTPMPESGPPAGRCRAVSPGKAAARARELAAAEAAPAGPPPICGDIALKRDRDGARLALHIRSEAQLALTAVRARVEGSHRILWEGRSAEGGVIDLSAEQLGAGPAAIPVEIECDAGVRRYVLFIPTMARLGETAPRAPRATYRGESLASALADLSALTGLVILAEPPLDTAVRGEVLEATPEAALRLLAASGDREVRFEQGLVATLTRPR